MNFPAERVNLIVKIARQAGKCTILEQITTSIDMPHEVERAQFRAAMLHEAEDMENFSSFH